MCAPLPAELLTNGLGQRVKKTVGSTVTLYHYDEGGKLLGEYNSSGTALYETVYLDDQPVAVIKPGSTATTYKAYYIYADHLNTPRLITDNAAGTANKKVWQWDSDPFGASVPNENPAGAGTFTYNPRFPGQVYDKETGLHYNYFRDYSPATGRYVQSDPIGLAGGINTFAYVGGNPVLYVDAFGLCWVYSQSTGQLTQVDANGSATPAGTGYAGHGDGVNNPAMQDVPNVGPPPIGTYTMGPQRLNITNSGRRLPASMRLTPSQDNQMFNRDGFLVHGPHENDNQDSSNGCPIFNKATRDKMGVSGDNCFQVVP
jgi:RHS repeat-associated protein